MTHEFPVWNTIKLGVYKSPADIEGALDDLGVHFSDWSGPRDLLARIKVVTSVTLIDLMSVSGRERGLTDFPGLETLYRRAAECGLSTVPAETGPVLLLNTEIIRHGVSFHIGMEPMAGLDGYLQVFEIRHDDYGRVIGSADFKPTYGIGIDIRWIFTRRVAT